MKASVIIAFLATAAGSLVFAIPAPTSTIRSLSSSSTRDSGKPTTRPAHECDKILEKCMKGVGRSERICKEYTCHKTKGSCFKPNCDDYARAVAGNANGYERFDEQNISTIVSSSSISAIDTASSSFLIRSARPKETDNHVTKRSHECQQQLDQCKRDLQDSNYICKARICYLTQKNCFSTSCIEPLSNRASDGDDDDDYEYDEQKLSTLAIAIPTLITSSSSSILRSAHPKEIHDFTALPTHECERILEQCGKDVLGNEDFCKSQACQKTSGACFGGHCALSFGRV